MTRHEASQYLREELNKYGLKDWSVRLNTAADSRFLGLCSHRDKCIILSAHHVDIHPTADVVNTIRHEVAHALTPGHSHDETWATKAREIGCDNTSPCSNLSLSPDIIDAIRSGATVEVTFDEEIIRKPKYSITRLQDKCEYCGKVAKSLVENTIENDHPTRPNLKIIRLECGHVIIKQIPKGTPFGLFQMGGNPDCKHVWIKNACSLCGRFRPYDFQIEGMKFLEAGLAVNKGAACFDDMGLGKTIQAGGVLKFHPEYWPVLWIVKSKLKWQFAKFIVQWMGDEHVPQIIERSADTLIPGLKNYIVGYDMLVPKTKTSKKGKISQQGFDIEKFDKRGIKTVVLDECQQIKNPDSTRTQMVRKVVKDRKVLPLSGTPWKNRGSELFPVFNMMDPVRFHSNEGFITRWVDRFWEGNRLREGGIRDPKAFREYTKDICIRRERTEVMKELPLVNRMKLYIQLDPTEQTVYDEEVSEFVKWYNSYVLEGREAELTGMNILAKMARMRHIVALAKIPQTLEFVDEFVEDTDRKLVIFVHHQDVGMILYDELKKKYDGEEISILKFTGGMTGDATNRIQDQFNSAKRCIMVASTLSSGEGLNLQTCADCVMHERQWNPGNEEQAEGRFIRIGQMHDSVSATYAEAEGSIDFHLDGINERKRTHFHATMNKGQMPMWNETAFAKELASSIVNMFNQKTREKSKGTRVEPMNKPVEVAS